MTGTKNWSLIFYNDNHNSIDAAIQALMQVMGYGFDQSEQIVLLTNLRGNCEITQRAFSNDLMKKKKELLRRGFDVELKAKD